MYCIYILYSASSNKFYVGFSTDPFRRLEEHNTTKSNTYTAKHRPWQLKAIFQCSEVEAVAMKTEKFIKDQKSRKLIEKLCDASFVPEGKLAQLIRVSHVRD